MAYLLDTGVLLRLIDQGDALHEVAARAVDALLTRDEPLFVALQNIAELWSVATRPPSDNGLGLDPAALAARIDRAIEPICDILIEHEQHYAALRRLLTSYDVRGKQVHDARLVASMLTWNVISILTLNERHFQRFVPEGIAVYTPMHVVASLGNP